MGENVKLTRQLNQVQECFRINNSKICVDDMIDLYVPRVRKLNYGFLYSLHIPNYLWLPWYKTITFRWLSNCQGQSDGSNDSMWAVTVIVYKAIPVNRCSVTMASITAVLFVAILAWSNADQSDRELFVNIKS